MEPIIKIGCDIASTNPSADLQLEMWIDNNKILDTCIVEHRHIEHRILDVDGEHELKFVLKNKKDSDTQIDEAGNIIKDSLIEITNLTFDDIELNHIMHQLSVYRHNSNGRTDYIEDKFYESMGCNGTVTLKFTTPIYLWLLENM